MFIAKTAFFALVTFALFVLACTYSDMAHADPSAPGFVSGTFSPYLDQPHVVIPAKTGMTG